MILYIFAFVFLFNLAPAFTPPTWAVLSYIEMTYHTSYLILALTGAVAATLGRLMLAKLSKVIIRDRFLSLSSIKNVDSVKEQLQKHKKLTFGIFLFYAFSPLPSNQLFLAYGLTDLNLNLIALPFFVGRFVSYLFWVVVASEVVKKTEALAFKNGSYFKSYFIIIQILTLITVYLFAKIDWHKLVTEKKISWIKK